MGFGTIIKSFSVPTTNCLGLAFDGKYLYTTDYVTSICYKLDMDGTIIRTFSKAGAFLSGIGYDGKYFYIRTGNGSTADKFNHDGTIINSYTILSVFGTGLPTDGKNFYDINQLGGVIVVRNNAFVQIKSFSVPGGGTSAMACTPKGLVFASQTTKILYLMDKDGKVLDTKAGIATTPAGMTFDGRNVWYNDTGTDLIYQIALG